MPPLEQYLLDLQPNQSQRQEKKGLCLLLVRVLAAATVGRYDGQTPLAKICRLEQKTQVSDGKNHQQ